MQCTGNSPVPHRSSTRTEQRVALELEQVPEPARQPGAPVLSPRRPAAVDTGLDRDRPAEDKSTRSPQSPTTTQSVRSGNRGARLPSATGARHVSRSAGYHHARPCQSAVPTQPVARHPAQQLQAPTSQPSFSSNHLIKSSRTNFAQIPVNLSTSQTHISPTTTANFTVTSHVTVMVILCHV